MSKVSRINCQLYDNENCMHHLAPSRFFGKTKCLLLSTPKDPRIKKECALQYEYQKPDGKLLPPPGRIIYEGVKCGRRSQK